MGDGGEAVLVCGAGVIDGCWCFGMIDFFCFFIWFFSCFVLVDGGDQICFGCGFCRVVGLCDCVIEVLVRRCRSCRHDQRWPIVAEFFWFRCLCCYCDASRLPFEEWIDEALTCRCCRAAEYPWFFVGAVTVERLARITYNTLSRTFACWEATEWLRSADCVTGAVATWSERDRSSNVCFFLE